VLQHLLLTVGVVAAALVAAALIRGAAHLALRDHKRDRARFWIAQATHLLVLAGIVFGVVWVWKDRAPQLGQAATWLAAGLTIALQRVVTAFAGYLIILRGNVFTVGDRIMIGGVRGDVVALGFMQTTVMEMGQSPGEHGDNPSMWIAGRQYSGRLVRITNDKIFDTPVYNYTRDFPYMWEEIQIPVAYDDDYRVVERIMLETARQHTAPIMDEARPKLSDLRGRYFLSEDPKIEPETFLRLTDNWQELAVRFIARPRGARGLKSAMSREIIAQMNEAKIGVASGTYAIVQMPTLEVRQV
jgi:small-conductance mechanosensitive channel